MAFLNSFKTLGEFPGGSQILETFCSFLPSWLNVARTVSLESNRDFGV